MLLRLEPNWCYPIPWDRYVKAIRFRRGGQSVFQLVTLDGPVEFLDGRLGTTLGGIELGVRQVRPPEPSKQIERGQRERRTDHRPRRRLLRAAAFFLSSMLLLGGATLGVIFVGEESPAHDWLAFGVLIGLLLLLPATFYGIYTALSLHANYRCPSCGLRLPRADEARPAVHFYCASCNVQWDTKRLLLMPGPRHFGRFLSCFPFMTCSCFVAFCFLLLSLSFFPPLSPIA